MADCTAPEVRRLVTEFISAINAGNAQSLQRLVTKSGQGFEWYSTDKPGQRINAAARDRAGLGAYFMQRHAAHEVLRLTTFKFNGNSAGYGNFQYTLIRQADDLPATPYVGKGAAVCDTTPRTIGVWSMARNPAE